jgi:hypothetical protein
MLLGCDDIVVRITFAFRVWLKIANRGVDFIVAQLVDIPI